MKMIQFTSSLALASVFVLVGCSDPADSVPKAEAGTAQEAPEAAAEGKRYTIQPESTIGFTGSKVTGSHDGGFKEFEGTIVTTDGQPAVGTEITINMHSTWSDNDRLTQHLKSADFFNVDEHPQATFSVTAIDATESGTQVTGNLHLHGVTKSISYPATVSVTDASVTVKAEFAINRKDFDIVYAGKPDDLIRDNVVIRLDITATPEGT